MDIAPIALSLGCKLTSGAPLSDDDYYSYLEALDAPRPSKVRLGPSQSSVAAIGDPQALATQR